MGRNWKTLECVGLMCCALFLAGCGSGDDESDAAAEEVEQLRIEVAKLKQLVAKRTAERDELTGVLSEAADRMATATRQLEAMVKERDQLQTKLNQLAQTHDSATLRAQEAQKANENLQKQLQEKMNEAQELQNYNRELNVTLERLQNAPQPEENQPAQAQPAEAVE
jgi:chromosome segregation ATPase